MQDSSKDAVLKLLHALEPKVLLDAPCGDGWLAKRFDRPVEIDGIDLFENPQSAYRNLYAMNLDDGLPDTLGQYDCIASCEGLEHLGNPELFLRSAYSHLKPGGVLLLTTPNIWYPQAKLQYLFRGFFPSFPSLVGKIQRGTHMHILPWSFPQLFLFLKLSGFVSIELHEEPLGEAKHFFEKFVALPQYFYCLSRLRRSKTAEEKSFWQLARSKPSLYGRHLIITAKKDVLQE